MTGALFDDRHDAGRILAGRLAHLAGREDLVVLALPRGGVPVAWEVAGALGAPLDVLAVRKLGVPGREELAMGAIAGGGATFLDSGLIAMLQIDREAIARTEAAERRELERRERLYRGGGPPLELAGRTALLVDDGLATGATMRVAVMAARGAGAERVVVAVPVGAPEVRDALARHADEVICAETPSRLGSVGQWYEDFGQTSDAQVQELLATPPRAGGPA